MRAFTSYLLTLLLGFGLVSVFGCESENTYVDVSADIEAINKLSESEFALFRSGNVAGLTAMFSSDGVIMAPDAPLAAGEEALETFFQGMTDTYTVGGEYTSSVVNVMGDLAIERYTGTLNLTGADGETTVLMAKGIHIYQRQSDGSWLITHDVWNYEGADSNEM